MHKQVITELEKEYTEARVSRLRDKLYFLMKNRKQWPPKHLRYMVLDPMTLMGDKNHYYFKMIEGK